MERRLFWVAGALAALAAACGRADPAPVGTGAEAAVRTFFEGLLHKDWPRAYGALEAESRARCGADRFARLAQNYRQGLGFEPQEVHLRSCEEHGAEAVAHVAFAGRADGRRRVFRDGVSLRRNQDAWGVVLPTRFGQAR
jgi:hypothetical protein